jgi:hypothetical protein
VEYHSVCTFFFEKYKLVSKLQSDSVLEIIQGDQKISVHLMITIQKFTSNVPSAPASR